MANILKNKFYPYIEKYIKEYLHGFEKDRIDIQLTKGEVNLEKMSLRPDTINKIMDEQNVPFWIKVGLITKIHVGASLLSVIGEIPIEVEIEGINIILSPSYKWIINNIDKLKNKDNNDMSSETPNPLGNDIFNKKPDEFDTSIFNIKKIQEIFTDKTAISNILNGLFKSLYSFYTAPNFSVNIKIKKIHIRFEDDELINYTGDIAYGLRIDLIQIKAGNKGNMKKNGIKLESLDIYWEDNAKILISSQFLNSCIEDGKLQERYYKNLKTVRFEKFENLISTKYIVQDFNFSLNLGTKSEKRGDLDIFNLKTPPSMVYFQLASNELNVNCYPDFLKIMNNFNEFLSQFPIIDKVKDYRPFIKPTNGNNLNYMNLVENYRKNVIDNKNKGKMLVRDWINYIYWFQKSKNGEKRKIINPIRTEFVRFYNICFKKMDIHEKKEEKAPLKEEKNKNKEKSTNSHPNPPETKTTETPTPKENETPTEIKEPEEKLIPKDFEFSSRIDLLIKGLNISLHSSLDDKVKEYISICINGVEIKIRLDKTIFEFNLKVKTIDLGPSNLIVGERVIIQPKSYRKAIPEQSMTSLKTNIPYGNLSTYNYISLPNSELGSNITGLIKKYNPRHEEKIKVIDEALELAQSQSRVMSLAASEFGDVGKFRGPKIKSKTPFGNEGENLGRSIINVNINNNVNDLGKTYGTVLVPRNVSFAKNLIDGYETNSLQNRRYQRKKDKEMNISQAINDYNSYKIYEKSKNKFRTSHSPQPSLSSSRFNLRESRFGINPVSARNKNTPLNLLEIFSNTEVGALSIKFTKYNNPITIDNLAIQIGTIRLNLFVNYLLDILRILSDFKKATNIPKIAKSEGPNAVSGKIILEIQEYFYKYITEKMPDKDKTESVIEYMEYLRKEISSKKKFSSKPQHYDLNQIFTVFPKGFDFHFDYENIELVAYDKNNIVSTKMIIPSNEFIFGINFTKIFIKLLDLEMDISDLNRCESIIDQLKGLAEDKFKVVQIVLKPCYKEIKEGIEPLLKDNEEEYKQILKNANNNINLNNNNDNINSMVNIPQDNAQNLVKNEQKNINQENILMQKNKENELLDLMIKNHKDNELLIQKQKEKSQSYFSQQSNNQQLLHPSQIQQKKNNSNIAKIPKIPHISQNYNQLNQNDALPKSPRDSKRSKNSENQMSKIEGTSSYQLVGDTVYLGQQQIMNNNYNSNLDYLGNNHLSNTQYNVLAPNMNNYGYNEFYKTYQNENNNNFV
jgi:hypothetical protein